MDREEIIQRIRQLDREQLRQLLKYLDLLADRPENQTRGKAPDPEESGSVQ